MNGITNMRKQIKVEHYNIAHKFAKEMSSIATCPLIQ
jgi:hypothetical protein